MPSLQWRLRFCLLTCTLFLFLVVHLCLVLFTYPSAPSCIWFTLLFLLFALVVVFDLAPTTSAVLHWSLMSSPNYDSNPSDSVDILQIILDEEQEQRRKRKKMKLLQVLLLVTLTHAVGLCEPDNTFIMIGFGGLNMCDIWIVKDQMHSLSCTGCTTHPTWNFVIWLMMLLERIMIWPAEEQGTPSVWLGHLLLCIVVSVG